MRGKHTQTATPKVAHVTTVDLSLRYLLLNQLERIRDEGYEVVGISADGPDVATVEAHGIPHFAVPMTRRFTPFADLRALWALTRIMRRERFDVVHTHTPKAGLLGQLAARLSGVPVIVNTLHGFYFHEGTKPLSRRFYVWMERIAAKCSDSILSQNKEDIATAVAESGVLIGAVFAIISERLAPFWLGAALFSAALVLMATALPHVDATEPEKLGRDSVDDSVAEFTASLALVAALGVTLGLNRDEAADPATTPGPTGPSSSAPPAPTRRGARGRGASRPATSSATTAKPRPCSPA